MLEDEIQQLRQELRETADENGRVYKLLKERDFEIKHLRKKIEEDRLAFTGSSTTQPPSALELRVSPVAMWAPEARCPRGSTKGPLWSHGSRCFLEVMRAGNMGTGDSVGHG